MGAFQRVGMALPRTVAQQYDAGQPVPKGQLRFGDVVFFNRYCQVWKAGPYMAAMLPFGPGGRDLPRRHLPGRRALHARLSPGGGNRQLNDEVWRASFIGARRFFLEKPPKSGGFQNIR